MTSAQRVYFAFASGRLNYDCPSCDARCCRGHGYAIREGAELQAHLASRPYIRFFLDQPRTDTLDYRTVRNCQPGCFFLSETGLCGIQAEHGYDAKPETCRLFPFNYIRRAADYLIVAPHVGLCPLHVVAPDRVSVLSRHDQLLAAIGRQGHVTNVLQATAVREDVASLIALEQQIVQLSEQALRNRSYLPFAAVQLLATRTAMDVPTGAPHSLETADADMRRFVHALSDVLGIGRDVSLVSDDQAIQTLTGLTPFVRSQFVFSTHTGSSDIGLERVPHVLVALCALALLARKAGLREVTYLSLTQMLGTHRALLAMLAHIDSVVMLRPSTVVEFPAACDRDSQARYLRVLKGLLPSQQRKNSVPLHQLLCDNMSGDDVARVTFLNLMARQLEGRIVPVDRPSAPRKLRPVVQQWALAVLSEDVLLATASRVGRQ